MSRWARAQAAIAVGLFAGCLWVIAKPSQPDPLAQRACESCHAGAQDNAGVSARLLLASQERLCAECHPSAVKLSHPSGVRPSMTPHAAYPLDWKGELTCSSCHEIHRGTHGALRGALRGRPFCEACHGNDYFERMADGGESLVVSGHLDVASMGERLLDPFSTQCMGCHGEAGNGSPGHTGKGLNHPVGVNYGDSERFGGYRRQASLDPAIELPGGLVSCVSCHQGYAARHGAVRTAQRGGDLCMECHAL